VLKKDIEVFFVVPAAPVTPSKAPTFLYKRSLTSTSLRFIIMFGLPPVSSEPTLL
jgi:hypothetical protein